MIGFESPAALHHLNTLQMIVNRMAANSASCKTWCVTLVFAASLLFTNTRESSLILIGFLPVFLFCIFDSYYLGLERLFQDDYKAFAEKLRSEEIQPQQLFEIDAAANTDQRSAMFRAMRSFSIWPFYSLLIMVLITLYGLIPAEAG